MEEIAISIVELLGLPGLVLVMFMAMIIVFIPSELTVALAGLAAANGELSLAGVFLASLAGVILGMAALYLLAKYIHTRRIRQFVSQHGHWAGVGVADLEKAEARFRRHQAKLALVGQVLPGVRFAVGVAAGIEQVPFIRYLLFTTIGAAVWVAGFVIAGYWLDEGLEAALEIYESIVTAVGVLFAAGIVLLIWRRRRRIHR